MKSYKPTSPSQRERVTVNFSELTKGAKPRKSMRWRVQANAGRNNRGVITMRHQGGGVKKLYRDIDFLMDKMGVPGTVETIEYDPYRTGYIACVSYKDGDRRYILATKDMKAGDSIVTSENAPITSGNRLALKNIPVGTFIHLVELRKGSGAKIARSAGAYAEVLAHAAGSTDIRFGSKTIRKISSESFASIGQVSNVDWNLTNIGKAGRQRHYGVRPTVRGTAMNPVDHPYGGGEGVQPRGTKRPKTMWGKVTGGHKTRSKRKWSNKLIVARKPKGVRGY